MAAKMASAYQFTFIPLYPGPCGLQMTGALSVATLLMEKFRGEQKNVTRFRDFLFLFYQCDFVVGLLQGFMTNAHESGSNSPEVGTLAGI